MALEITGKVVKVLPEQSGRSAKTGNDWRKGGFVIETESNFPKKVCLTAWGDLTSQVSSLQTGQNVKVSFDVESREFNDKWYTDLKAWRIEASGSEGDSGRTQVASHSEAQDMAGQSSDNLEETSDDLPF